VNTEHANTFVSINKYLDSLLEVVKNKHSIVEGDLNQNLSVLSEIDDKDVLISIKLKFLVGHCYAELRQFEQSLTAFEDSLQLQEELSFSIIRIPTLQALYEVSSYSKNLSLTFQYAKKLEIETEVPLSVMISILDSLAFISEEINANHDAIIYLDRALELSTDSESVFKYHLRKSKLLVLSGNIHESKKIHETLLIATFESIQQQKEVLLSYIQLVMDIGSHEEALSIAETSINVFKDQNGYYSEFVYYTYLIKSLLSISKLSSDDSKNLIELCIKEQNQLNAIKTIQFYITQQELEIQEKVTLLESAVLLFSDTIPIQLKIDIFEQLVELLEIQQEWKKGLQNFEQYQSILQVQANQRNKKELLTMEIKHKVEFLRREAEVHHKKQFDLSILQRQQQLRSKQNSEYEKFTKAISKTLLHSVYNPIQHFLDIPISNYSKDISQLLIDTTKSMVLFVETIIDLHTLEDKTYNGMFETNSITKVLDQLKPQFQHLSDQYQIGIDCYFGKEILWFGDIHLLSKVLYHLIHNSCKFSPEKENILISISTTTNELIITITDSGVGVAPEHSSLVFIKYFQFDPLGLHNNSAGIGLTFCKKAIEFLKGTISLLSEKDQGTTVEIRIPLQNSVSVPVPEQKTYSITSTPIELGAEDKELILKKTSLIDKETFLFSEAIIQLDSIEGSTQLQNWKNNLYRSLLYNNTENVNRLRKLL